MGYMISYKKLFDLLEQAKMTQTDLQRSLKCSSNTIGKIKNNEFISMKNLVAICEIFRCQISDIVEVAHDQTKTN